MKKINLLLIMLVCFFVGTHSVYAAEITSTKYVNNRITLQGTGTKQVQIVLFDTNNSPVYMTTASATDGSFNVTLPEIAGLSDGEYMLKAADYDGANVDTTSVTVTASEVVDTGALGTGDVSVVWWVVLLSISGAALLGIALSYRSRATH